MNGYGTTKTNFRKLSIAYCMQLAQYLHVIPQVYYKNCSFTVEISQTAKTPVMKKSILFASGLAFTAAFVGCDDGSARNAELQSQLDQAKQERDAQSLANQEELSNLTATYQYRVDSLQYVIDSLTAPKGAAPAKPKPKPAATTTTETPKTTTDPQKDRKSGSGNTVEDQKQRNTSTEGSKTDEQKKRNTP